MISAASTKMSCICNNLPQIANIFGIDTSHGTNNQLVPHGHTFDPKFKTIDTRGDGNCFFRSVSRYFFGHEAYHPKIRQAVVRFVLDNKEHFQAFVDRKWPQYFMDMSKTKGNQEIWGGTTEILAVATLLQSTFYVHCRYGAKRTWLPYQPLFKLGTPKLVPYIAIYHNGTHYSSIELTSGECICSQDAPVPATVSDNVKEQPINLVITVNTSPEKALWSSTINIPTAEFNLNSCDDWPKLSANKEHRKRDRFPRMRKSVKPTKNPCKAALQDSSGKMNHEVPDVRQESLKPELNKACSMEPEESLSNLSVSGDQFPRAVNSTKNTSVKQPQSTEKHITGVGVSCKEPAHAVPKIHTTLDQSTNVPVLESISPDIVITSPAESIMDHNTAYSSGYGDSHSGMAGSHHKSYTGTVSSISEDLNRCSQQNDCNFLKGNSNCSKPDHSGSSMKKRGRPAGKRQGFGKRLSVRKKHTFPPNKEENLGHNGSGDHHKYTTKHQQAAIPDAAGDYMKYADSFVHENDEYFMPHSMSATGNHSLKVGRSTDSVIPPHSTVKEEANSKVLGNVDADVLVPESRLYGSGQSNASVTYHDSNTGTVSSLSKHLNKCSLQSDFSGCIDKSSLSKPNVTSDAKNRRGRPSGRRQGYKKRLTVRKTHTFPPVKEKIPNSCEGCNEILQDSHSSTPTARDHSQEVINPDFALPPKSTLKLSTKVNVVENKDIYDAMPTAHTPMLTTDISADQKENGIVQAHIPPVNVSAAASYEHNVHSQPSDSKLLSNIITAPAQSIVDKVTVSERSDIVMLPAESIVRQVSDSGEADMTPTESLMDQVTVSEQSNIVMPPDDYLMDEVSDSEQLMIGIPPDECLMDQVSGSEQTKITMPPGESLMDQVSGIEQSNIVVPPDDYLMAEVSDSEQSMIGMPPDECLTDQVSGSGQSNIAMPPGESLIKQASCSDQSNIVMPSSESLMAEASDSEQPIMGMPPDECLKDHVSGSEQSNIAMPPGESLMDQASCSEQSDFGKPSQSLDRGLESEHLDTVMPLAQTSFIDPSTQSSVHPGSENNRSNNAMPLVRKYNLAAETAVLFEDEDPFGQLIQSVRDTLYCQPGLLQDFVLVSSNINQLKIGQFYESSCAKITVLVQRNAQVIVEVHQKQLPSDHPLWQIVPNGVKMLDDLIALTSFISKQQICVGNYDEDMVESGSRITSKLFYIEGNFGAKRKSLKYHKSVRSIQCAFLLHPKVNRCPKCKAVRVGLRVKKSRAKKSKQKYPNGLPKQKTNRDLTKEEMCKRSYEKSKEIRKLKARNKRLDTALKHIKEHGEELTEKGSKDMIGLMNEHSKEFQALHPDPDSNARIFWDSQLKIAKAKSKRGMRWDPRIIKWCIYIHSKSPKAYDVLTRLNFIELPTARNLFDYSHVLPSKPGLQPKNIEHFIKEVEAKGIFDNPKQNFFVLIQDEIRIKESLVYDRHNGELIGFVDIESFSSPEFASVDNDQASDPLLTNLKKKAKAAEKDPTSKQSECKSKTPSTKFKKPLAKYMLVLMVRGLAVNLQYPVAAYATTGVTSDVLFEVIWPTVEILEVDCGLRIVAFTCDGASPNRKFFKMHGLQGQELPIHWCWNPFASDEKRKIFFISDAPHLLKTGRNCFGNSFAHRKSRRMFKGGQDISWLTLRKLYEDHSGEVWVTAPKLTAKHLWLTPWAQMKVNLAAQVFSKTVANALRYHYGDRYSETADFIELWNDWFDCMNTRHLDEGNHGNNNLKPYTSVNDIRFRWMTNTFLQYFEDWLAELHQRRDLTAAQIAQMTLSHQTLDGIKITTKSVIECSKFMLNRGCKFILTNKFNQDPLEALFGELRRRGGSSDNPTVQDIRHGLSYRRTIGGSALAPLHANVQAHSDVNLDSIPLPRCKRPRK